MSNEKGGVAKTTSTLSLGAALAELNYRVLLMDLDPQANLSLALGLETGESTVTSANILIENAPVRSAIRKTDIKNLELVPSSFRIETAEQFLPMRTHYLNTLHDALIRCLMTISCSIARPPSARSRSMHWRLRTC
jgi:chromosome partitioning protein